eukprot:gnl/TRDRNA2_/TRDRNA2_92169_c0_seq1.p1 gnl/TRDRNA2_/TRDRNA2_92169_c0~~gnl/TRDRNA2_/TRDRNA2_92169_c0_seq1.p1  ORF type:complete len:283 (+),score=49.82 gnl/TRDRNA2_/TRDRNA2_92169_c0_seq1:35-883(+)
MPTIMPEQHICLAEGLLQDEGHRRTSGCSWAAALLPVSLCLSFAAFLSRGSAADGLGHRLGLQELAAISDATPAQSAAHVVRPVQRPPTALVRFQPRVAAPSFLGGAAVAAELGDAPSVKAAGVKSPSLALKAASAAVTALKPIYSVEAPTQARVAAGAGYEQLREEVRKDIDSTLKSSPCVVYSYPLSPFCTEAIALLESTGAKVKVIEPGLEWFLLGPKGSVIRAELGEMTGQTSFPHIFIGGTSVGGLFSGGAGDTGIAGLADTGELQKLLQKAGALGA